MKEGISWATATALAALQLAEGGSTGPLDLLDHAPHRSAAGILDRLAGPPAICQTYFKFHSCCRHVHAPVEALLSVMTANARSPKAIDAVEVHIYRCALNLSNRPDPANLVDVQYSIPYCLGLVALLPLDSLPVHLSNAGCRGHAGQTLLRSCEPDLARAPFEERRAQRVSCSLICTDKAG